MSSVTQETQPACNFLDRSNNGTFRERNCAEPVYKNIDFIKTETVKLNNNQAANSETKAVHYSEAELLQLKEEIVILKKEICLKDEEINKLKLNLVDVKDNMEQFSYVASHDLKEPLRMVTSYLGLLKNKFGSQLDDKANTYIDFAIDGGAKLHTMFNGLLDLSQTGRIDKPKRNIPLNEIVEDVKSNLSKKIRAAKAEINIVGDLPVVEVYENSVVKLFENLICNAMKFSKPDETPVVQISAVDEGTCWQICVADNGIGIDSQYYNQIFAVFSKLHNSNVYPGNGIGLAICKKAVEHHGGALWVNAELDKGSKFYFTLPK